MFCFEPAQLDFGVKAVNVDHEDVRYRSGSNGNIVLRILSPPMADRAGVDGRVLEPVDCCRILVAQPAWKDVHSVFSKCQCRS